MSKSKVMNKVAEEISVNIKKLNELPHILERVKTGRTRLCHKKDGSYVLQEEYREKYLDWKYTSEESLNEIKQIWQDVETYEEETDKNTLSAEQKLQLCMDTMQTVIDNTSEISTMQLLSDILERIKND